jgi:hypothetical protein
MRVTNGIPLGCSRLLPVDTVNCVQTLKAEIEANARFGVDWTNLNDWSKISEADWRYTYWEPSWDFGLDDIGATATASISPEIIITLWHVVPLVIKPKPFIQARFGDATSNIKPQSVVDSLTCDAVADKYALEAGLDVGIGIKDVGTPDDLDLIGGITLIKEQDFGQFNLVPATAFGSCGPLCAGCLPRYKTNQQEYTTQAYASSADKVFDVATLTADAASPSAAANTTSREKGKKKNGVGVGVGIFFAVVVVLLLINAVALHYGHGVGRYAARVCTVDSVVLGLAPL